MSVYDARAEDLVQQLVEVGTADDWLDYLVEPTFDSAQALRESAFDVFRDLLARTALLATRPYVELSFPLRSSASIPEPGGSDDTILVDIEFSESLLGVPLPRFYLRSTNPPQNYPRRGRVTVTSLFSSRVFSRHVTVEHVREEFEDGDNVQDWLRYVAPIT
jgi:hypothetical protein